MFKKTTQQGFTLIELLVVIAIIGILAATVLASLGTARSSGSDASAKSSITSVRNQAEMFYTANGNTYANLCTDPGVTRLLDAAKANGKYPTATTITAFGTAQGNAVGCHVDAAGASWAASVPLSTGPAYFCVDSTGRSTSTATALAVSTSTCPL